MNEIVFAPEHLHWPSPGFFRHLLQKAAGVVALGGLWVGRLERHWMRIEEVEMPLRGLGPAFDGQRLVQISDLHCSPIVREGYLRQCVDMINSLAPDFVTVTGDLMIGPRRYAQRVARVLGRLRPKVATLACLGNHDYGVWRPVGIGEERGLKEYLCDHLAAVDVIPMNNESRVFRRDGSALQFVGLEDYWTAYYDPEAAFEGAEDLPTIALCHNPDAAAELADRGAQWILAGHTHGNPFTRKSLRRMAMPTACLDFVAGSYRLGGDSTLYVNRGVGYARRMNLNSRPEITVFTLRSVTGT